jgi:hypothetical protein
MLKMEARSSLDRVMREREAGSDHGIISEGEGARSVLGAISEGEGGEICPPTP